MRKVVFQFSWGKRDYPKKSGIVSDYLERNKDWSLLNTVSVRVHGRTETPLDISRSVLTYRELSP